MNKKKVIPIMGLLLTTSLLLPTSAVFGLGGSPTIETPPDKEFTRPPHPVFSWNSPGKSSPVLHPGSARGAGMMQGPLNKIDQVMSTMIEDEVMPGAVSIVARRGHIVQHESYGYAARYLDGSKTEMDNPIKMQKDTIFDLASISKVFTTTAAMILYEQGQFDLDDPVSEHIPEFAQNGKEDVTIRQLMTHTSGFTAWVPLYTQGETREDRLQYVFAYPLKNEPGESYTYSDLNMITLGALVERLSGKRLDQFVYEHITEPLKMHDTMYNPPNELKNRIAATEYQAFPDRGLVWGSVHDENAWSLDGVAGHAGVFSTATDLAKFAHMFVNDGKYGGKQILKPETVELLVENQIPQFPADSHGLGYEIDQGWYMDALTGSSIGHTGYTGTSMVINKHNNTIAILLTNRVHPTRETTSTNPARRQFARQVADAIPAAIPNKDKAWFAGYGDHLDNTLTAEVNLDQETMLNFDTWFRLENGYDFGKVEISTDGEQWTAIKSFTGSSNWQTNQIQLPADTKFVRFHYETDDYTNNRGWYIYNASLTTADGQTFTPEFLADGWERRNY
ncbi:serine hydrolase domain-containing protein [Salinibacillus xinjiangensis]|uniref:Serine hydrolase n=1 Tax=Salinibacillus xinjiangensis TaxID=1229268 RepID=A0A6G1X1Q6_9BACI|nr:serine hydrolase domain-containing protein [Salinibacillus xinjiangensis]MRG84927.1 serine hydrolase [Salinibacillus xinjiangensis]